MRCQVRCNTGVRCALCRRGDMGRYGVSHLTPPLGHDLLSRSVSASSASSPVHTQGSCSLQTICGPAFQNSSPPPQTAHRRRIDLPRWRWIRVAAPRPPRGSAHCLWRHPRSRHEMVQVSIDGSRQPQSAEADVVQCLDIQQHALVHILAEQVKAGDYVVWLHRRIEHLGRRNDREGLHDAIGVFLTYLQDLKRSHT